VRRQSLRCLRREGVRCLGRLHDSHQGQSQKVRLNRIERSILPGKGLPRRASSGEEMSSGADNPLADRASQPPHTLPLEGGELVGIDSAGLCPRIAQLGGSRIESKEMAPQVLTHPGARTTRRHLMAIEKSSVFRSREASEDPNACTTGSPPVPQMCSHPPTIRLSAVATRRAACHRVSTPVA
jgi:hypothetical protein